jgi:hypothetical protein
MSVFLMPTSVKTFLRFPRHKLKKVIATITGFVVDVKTFLRFPRHKLKKVVVTITGFVVDVKTFLRLNRNKKEDSICIESS